jgi:hypothetical protein
MSLSPQQIADLTRKDDIRLGSHKSRWLSPNDAEHLLGAMDAGKKQVILAGKKFTVKYETRDKVFVKPTTGPMVPCGWYTRQLLKSIAAND